MRVLVACECSGAVRRAFRALGHDAWSCDIQPADDGSPYHIHGDVLEVLEDGWDMMIAHPECTRLANSGVRWLRVPPPGKTLEQMWRELEEGCAFYKAVRAAPIPKKVIENPVMHRHARERIKVGPRQVVQPHWFGVPAFKATGFELINVPPLKRTHWMELPKKGTKEHKQWSAIHRESPGPRRAKNRSRTFDGLAQAMAAQWTA